MSVFRGKRGGGGAFYTPVQLILLENMVVNFGPEKRCDWKMASCALETTEFPGSYTGTRISEQIESAVRKYEVDPAKICEEDAENM